MKNYIQAGVLVLLLILTGLTFYKGVENQHRMSELAQGMTAVKQEVQKAVPAPLGHWHHTVRIFMIKAQGGQTEPGGIILIGDSITEGIFLDRVCGLSVINAGIGGAGVSLFNSNLEDILSTSKPSVAFIALGVNDSNISISEKNEEYIKNWAKNYESLVDNLIKKGIEPVLSTILPVEKDKELGTKYFNAALINRLNEKIREISDKEELILADSYAAMADSAGFIPQGSTLDGVHLKAESYKIWKETIVKSLTEALAKKGIGCGKKAAVTQPDSIETSN
jgi:lysophospholipase L1-like esterase